MVFWKTQGPQIAGGRPTAATAGMQARLDALSHPSGTQRVHRIIEEGPHGEGTDCPPWFLAAESRLFSGPRELIVSFYKEPHQIVFVDELRPQQASDPYILLGHSPEGWGLKPEQIPQAYIVYELVSSDCESGHEDHHH